MFKPNVNHTRGFTTFYHTRGQTSDSWKVGSWSAIQDLIKKHFGDHVPYAPNDPNTQPYSEGQLLQYLYNIKDRKKQSGWFAAQVFGPGRCEIRENPGNSPFFLWID